MREKREEGRKVDFVLPESDVAEWKWAWRDEYLKQIAAFANTDGGVLNIGVNDDGYVVGLKNCRKLLEDLPNKCRDKLKFIPKIKLRWSEFRGANIRYPNAIPNAIASKDVNRYVCGAFVPKNEHERAKLEKWEKENPVSQDSDGRFYYIEIIVERLPYLVTYDGVAYTRSGSTLQRLEGAELEAIVLRNSGRKWDSFPASTTFDELDPAALKAFRRKSIAKGRLFEGAADASTETLLKNLNLLTSDGRITRAGAMMFGDPEKVVAGAYVKLAYFAPNGSLGLNSANDIIYHDDVHGPLALLTDKTLELLYSKYMKAFVDYRGLQRIETYMLPIEVLREALMNAVMHKNYASGNPIQIRVYDDHVSIMNEGFWPFDVLPVEDAYKREHESYRYNPLLAELFYKTGEVETWGRGFERIAVSCEQADCPLPEIQATPRSVKLICKGSAEYMRLLRRSFPEAPSGGEVRHGRTVRDDKVQKRAEAYLRSLDFLKEVLTKSELKKILPIFVLFKDQDDLTSETVAESIQRSCATARRRLNKLIELNVLVRVGKARETKYRLDLENIK